MLYRLINFIKFSSLPLLTAIYPVVFHYSNNLGIVAYPSFIRLLLLFICIGLVSFCCFSFIKKSGNVQAANGAFIFIVFFQTYGMVYFLLRTWDKMQVEHYTLLPLLVLLSLYASRIGANLNEKMSINLWQTGLLIIVVLVAYNVFRISLYGFTANLADKEAVNLVAQDNSLPASNKNYPDIYYIVFDEMVGFEAMRQYWEYEDVDSFVDFLNKNGFYVAENSYASAPSTMNQIASRLNYNRIFPYDVKERSLQEEQMAIANSEVFRYLKSLGYTTVAFTELRSRFLFAGMPALNVDVLYENPPEGKIPNRGILFDDFIFLVTKNSMLLPLVENFVFNYPLVEGRKEMIFFTLYEAPRLEWIDEPKFVYIHLVIPHPPFIFDKNGALNDQSELNNWNNYFGQYIYSLQLAKALIEDILNLSDQKSPPVIVFQSDHGARNITSSSDDISLKNYPEKYKTLIVNTMFLPGCEANLSQDMNPVNTFPIVFNCYFDANIPLK